MSTEQPTPTRPGAGDAGVTPKISILVCTRNRANQLAGTLKSLSGIVSALPWEAIILDNGSTDATAEVIHAACAADPRLRYAYEAQPGLGAARDSGWRLARGEIISLSDDDCYFTPDYLDNVWAVFSENPDVGVVGGKILLYDPQDVPLSIDLRSEPVRTPAHSLVKTGAFHGANLSFRREALQRSGGFDRNLGAGTPFPAEDIDAVAAVIWAGYGGLYDPRPTVLHHHGRRMEHVARQRTYHDEGRGAYYAKYVLHRPSRAAYFADWRERYGPILKPHAPRRSSIELAAGIRYALRFGRPQDLAAVGARLGSMYASAYVWRLIDGLRQRIAPTRPKPEFG
jgi:glycosyltransferase involved in cell wall biosynthesis